MSKVVSKVETQSSVPLVVDLDGTLVKTDLLIESLLVLLKHNLLYLFLLPFWLLRGKAYFKHQVAVRADMDPALLPYDRVFLEFLKQEYQEGRELILATASDETLAAKVANHIGLFREVIASDGITNRAGAGKLHAIQQLCGDSGFAYAGNAPVDKEIWR